ncbi:ATP-binding domain-containing protein [Ruminococcus sp. OA3]|uniref:HelD family protein n=1 Tax=Ruminococcus sp. OA3 TaxID=2914164 RepID=UPI001F06851C|nr:ATP-binding domain-containing protein [Ruminococcus sp. OA3]MCH1982432.1 ATP-binding domain-containing protein [Ruminococcus sp. OA3]
MSDQKKPGGTMLFPDEITHLASISCRLDEALLNAGADVRKIDREYMDTKRYMVENRGEIDPNEMFQNELLLRQTDHTGSLAVRTRDTLARMKESPYFARIDFFESKSPSPVPCYIGRFTFSHKNELLIFDWRAPVSSMFYDYETGPAGYDSPAGRVQGTLTRKRQFKITDGVMEYVIESSANIQDDVLQRELAHTSDEKMKSIIATIQREQNQIIRNEHAKTMIIQGVAGSGKTSIALHRIAFLLYRFRNQLKSQNVTILSPNKVFSDYIAGVIPELGEEPIFELSFADIAKIQLKQNLLFEPDSGPLEIQDENRAQRVCFKSTGKFVELMNAYIAQLPDRIFKPRDYSFGGFTADAGWIFKRFYAYRSFPVKQRLSMTADDIYHRFESENIMEDDLPSPRMILKSLTAMLTVKNSLAIYKDFYRSLNLPRMFMMPAKKTLEWADVFPFLYIQAAFEGLKKSQVTKHLVIDEMQDYTPIQYTVINLLFSCPKTILGDFGQSLSPYRRHTLSDLRQIYDGAEYVELSQSYRSTYEIMTFAKYIGGIHTLKPIERHGDIPDVASCADRQEEIQRIKKAICAFMYGKHATLGIITKTDSGARELYDILCHEGNIQLLTPESTGFTTGITITSIQMAKGLEFDEVIVPDTDSLTYGSDYDRSLLYIACTRAMHGLTLLFTGAPSPFILPAEETDTKRRS